MAFPATNWTMRMNCRFQLLVRCQTRMILNAVGRLAVLSAYLWAVFYSLWHKIHLDIPFSVRHALPPFFIRVWDYPNKHFSFSGKGPENPKNRKRVLACCACYRNPSLIFPSTNTTIWSGDFGCFHFKLCKNRLCSMLNSSIFTHTRRQSLPVKITKAK